MVNFGSFLGHYGQFWVIFELFWVNFRPFFGANFFWPKMVLSITFSISVSEERVNNFANKILCLDQDFDDMSFLLLLFYLVPVVALSPMMLLMTIAFLWTHMMLLIR